MKWPRVFDVQTISFTFWKKNIWKKNNKEVFLGFANSSTVNIWEGHGQWFHLSFGSSWTTAPGFKKPSQIFLTMSSPLPQTLQSQSPSPSRGVSAVSRHGFNGDGETSAPTDGGDKSIQSNTMPYILLMVQKSQTTTWDV